MMDLVEQINSVLITSHCFQKPDGIPINDAVRYVEFRFDGAGKYRGVITHTTNGRTLASSAWSWRDAQSLVETGHWVEINDPTIADKPLSPTVIEGGAW